mmetsp:Transcript_166427/g.534648  ORF Transcript_166427/g.534648 Transcript_166427/m.534648 type:complete len:201 (+) Transcript_166427:10-612(+)
MRKPPSSSRRHSSSKRTFTSLGTPTFHPSLDRLKNRPRRFVTNHGNGASAFEYTAEPRSTCKASAQRRVLWHATTAALEMVSIGIRPRARISGNTCKAFVHCAPRPCASAIPEYVMESSLRPVVRTARSNSAAAQDHSDFLAQAFIKLLKVGLAVSKPSMQACSPRCSDCAQREAVVAAVTTGVQLCASISKDFRTTAYK